MPNEESFAEALGEVLADLRRQRGLSQEALAYRCKRSWVYISELERGKKSPTVRTLLAIATALDTVPSDLLREAERTAESQDVDPEEPK